MVCNDENDALLSVTINEVHNLYCMCCHIILIEEDGHFISESYNETDDMILEEKNELFNSQIAEFFDGKYLLIQSSVKELSEVYYINLRSSEKSKLTCIAKGHPKVLYCVVLIQGHWMKSTNVGGISNLSLMEISVGDEKNGKNWSHPVIKAAMVVSL